MSGRRVREVRALISVEAKERTAEMARAFSAYCRQLGDAFDTLNVPDERKVQMLSAVRINF